MRYFVWLPPVAKGFQVVTLENTAYPITSTPRVRSIQGKGLELPQARNAPRQAGDQSRREKNNPNWNQ